MKKLILTLFVVMASAAADADEFGCLPYDLEGVQEISAKEITNESQLTSFQAYQVRETAKSYPYVELRSEKTQVAINALRDESEGRELNYTVFRYKGQLYTEVVLYPGGNAYGLVFKGNKLFAIQGDGDFACQE